MQKAPIILPVRLSLAALFFALCLGLPAAEAKTSNPHATYHWLKNNVFGTCQYCHIAIPGVGFASHRETMSTVVPGNPEGSRLYVMVATKRMPKGGAGLPPQTIQAIQDWILDGAREN